MRVEHGLSYSPSSNYIAGSRFGAFLLSTDVDMEDMDRALKHFHDETNILINGSADSVEIEKTKKKILLSWVQGYESNLDIADYYVSKHHELTRYGQLVNHEDKLERVTPDDIKTVAARYFIDRQSIIVKATPTLTYTQFYILIIVLLFTALFIIFRAVRKMRSHRAAA